MMWAKVAHFAGEDGWVGRVGVGGDHKALHVLGESKNRTSGTPSELQGRLLSILAH